jgi:FkbM family methyltransferase
MALEVVREAGRLVTLTRNPHALVLDRLGVKTQPYSMLLRNGLRVQLRPGRGDRHTFYETFLRGDYTVHGQPLSPGDVVIDVGANIGCFTLLAARAVGPTGKVFALEPNAESFQQLVHNIRINGLSNVCALRLAMGGRIGLVPLHNSAVSLFSSTYSSVNNIEISGETEEVEMTTISTFMQERSIAHCDYLKLDCEGSEYDILRDLPVHSVAQIGVEFHLVEGSCPSQATQRLARMGFRRVYSGSVSCFQYRDPNDHPDSEIAKAGNI